jgi:hypothetical protein
MSSRREIARDWGVAKSWVDKCVTQRGCPTSSLEEARKWREENARRAPTGQKSRDRQTEEPEDYDPLEAKILIPLASAKDIAFHGYDFILELLDHLPQTVAARCNPTDPQTALTVLESECLVISCKAYATFAAWPRAGTPLSSAGNTE